MVKESVPVGCTIEDATYIRHLVRERSAIILNEDKEYLVHSRLEPLAKIGGSVRYWN